jgi:hypothetical protein
MATAILQAAFTNADISLFSDFGDGEGAERRVFRALGRMSLEDARGRIELAIEPAQTGGVGRPDGAGYVKFGPRQAEGGLSAPPGLFDRLEKVFFSPQRFRIILTLTILRTASEPDLAQIGAVSLLISPDLA